MYKKRRIIVNNFLFYKSHTNDVLLGDIFGYLRKDEYFTIAKLVCKYWSAIKRRTTKLKSHWLISNYELLTLISSHNIECIKNMVLSDGTFSDNSMLMVYKMTNLEKLDMSGCFNYPTEWLSRLPKLHHLRELSLPYIYDLTMTEYKHIYKLPNLEKLSIKYVENASCFSTFLQEISCKLSKIKHLNFSSCATITDSDVKNIVKLDNLETLILQDCYKITDKSIECIINKNITKLDLQRCFNITKKGIHKLSKLTNLYYLYLPSCRNEIDDDCIEKLSSLTKIKTLKVYSNKLTDKTIDIIINNMLELEYIYISCHNLSKNSIHKLSKTKNIKEIHLCGANEKINKYIDNANTKCIIKQI
jgi:hypothetical protein